MSTDFAKRIRSANMKIRNTIKHYHGEHGALDRLEHSLKVLYKDEYRGLRFFTPDNASDKKIERIENVLSMVENSPYFSKQGRKELGEKIQESFRSNTMHENFSDEQVERIFDIFQTDIWSKIRESMYGIESEIGIDAVYDIMEVGLGNSEIIDILNDYIKSTDNNKDLRSFVDNIL